MAIHKTQVCGYFRTYCRRSNDTMASRKRRDSLETGESVKRENSGLRESTSETLTAFTGSATSPLDAAVPISCSEEYVTARCAGVGERRLALIEEDRGQRETPHHRWYTRRHASSLARGSHGQRTHDG